MLSVAGTGVWPSFPTQRQIINTCDNPALPDTLPADRAAVRFLGTDVQTECSI
jgi:hypothetical protein